MLLHEATRGRLAPDGVIMENRGRFADGAQIADRRLDVGQRLVGIVPHHGAVGEDRPQILQVAMFDGVEQALARRHLVRSEEHTSELQSLMRISYAVFCMKK